MLKQNICLDNITLENLNTSLKENNIPSALSEIDVYLERHPGEPVMLATKTRLAALQEARDLVKQEKLPEAKLKYDQYCERWPQDTGIQEERQNLLDYLKIEQGKLFLNEDQLTLAREQFNDFLQRHPENKAIQAIRDHVDLQQNLRDFLHQHDWESADLAYQDFLHRYPDDELTKENYQKFLDSKLRCYAERDFRMEDFSNCTVKLKQYLIRHPNDIEAKDQLSKAEYKAECITAYSSKEFDKVIAQCSQLLQQDKQDLFALRYRSKAYLQQKHIDTAIQDFLQILSIQQDLEAYQQLAQIYQWRGNLSRAKSYLQLAIDLLKKETGVAENIESQYLEQLQIRLNNLQKQFKESWHSAYAYSCAAIIAECICEIFNSIGHYNRSKSLLYDLPPWEKFHGQVLYPIKAARPQLEWREKKSISSVSFKSSQQQLLLWKQKPKPERVIMSSSQSALLYRPKRLTSALAPKLIQPSRKDFAFH